MKIHLKTTNLETCEFVPFMSCGELLDLLKWSHIFPMSFNKVRTVSTLYQFKSMAIFFYQIGAQERMKKLVQKLISSIKKIKKLF